MNQLTKVQYPSYTEELSYDRAGNRTQRKTDKVEELYSYDPRNRLTEYKKGGNTTNFTYDNAGNLLSDNKAQYTYDAFKHTERVETFDGHVQINRYDAEELRHEIEEDGKLVQFIFQGDEVVAEEKENNIIRFIRGYELIASDAERVRTYYHYASDEMGSITRLVEGNVVCNSYEYDAWGNTTVCEETVENRFQFNGQQYDAITQQYYLRARFYNPVIARFTQEDTYWGDGLNLYAHCQNNPVYYVDPSGHWCEKKQDVYNRLLQERHLTEKDLIDNPDLKLQLMAEASNIVKDQRKNGESANNKSNTINYATNSSKNKPQTPESSSPDAESRITRKSYTGGRNEKELEELARDPAHANRIEPQGIKERQIVLDLEEQGRLGRVIRDPQADKGADFIDTTIKWDVKSFVSYPDGHTKSRKGAFKVGKAMDKINKELSRGHNVIIDTRDLDPNHITDLRNAIQVAGIENRIIWYP